MILTFFLSTFFISCSDEEPIEEYLVPPPVEVNYNTPYTVKQYTLSGNQKIDIYTPPDYDNSLSYPIIYFNDGDSFQDIFSSLTRDFPASFLMVGVHAGMGRNDKYIPYDDPWISQNWGIYTPSAAGYSEIFVNDIIPFVEEQVNVDASQRAIFGMSLGGLHATWIALKYPEYFSFVGALSPSYWVGDYAITNESVAELESSNQFYFDMGTEEWNYYVPFISRLKSGGLEYGNEIFYFEVFGGAHTSEDWGRRIHIPFLLFLSQGNPSGAVSYELFVECIPSQSTSGLVFQRLNPVVTFGDGTKYSLTTETSYEVISGSGEVTTDGRFDVDGETMTVRISYEDWSEEVDLTNCS